MFKTYNKSMKKMKETDIKQLDKSLSTISLKEINNISCDKELLNVAQILAKYYSSEEWTYPRLNELSPFPLKAKEQLISKIEKEIRKGKISEDCYDDIAMLSIIFCHLAEGVDKEFHFEKFNFLKDNNYNLTIEKKIDLIKTVISIEKEEMNKEKYLTLSHVLALILI